MKDKELERLYVMGSFISTELDAFENLHNELEEKDQEIERLKKENEYLSKKHEKIIHNIMEFVDKNTFNHRNTGERILTLHGKGILDLLDICLGSDKE